MSSQDRTPTSQRLAQRTEEERERARQERARRRAERARPATHAPAAQAGHGTPAAQPPAPGAGRAQAIPPGSPAAPLPAPDRASPARSPVAAGVARAPRKRHSRGARAGALAALLAAGFCVWFGISLFEPFAGPGSGSVIVVIPKGASASRIGSILARDDVVASSFFFDARALIEGKRGQLHSGRFELRRHMSYSAAIAALSAPPVPIALRLVIPEGFTRLQISRLAARDALGGSYMQASSASPLLDPADYGAPRGTADLEGFLFPATYELIAGESVQRLVQAQLRAFALHFGAAQFQRAHALGVTPYQLLIVASMVEREAEVARDRPLIAAVIYNRLRLGMPLGIDATLYYALAQREGISAYEHELTAAALHLASPYNTRLHAGLPPTPIANPGMASIEAAAHPAHVGYLYYVAGADGCGEHVFTSSYAQFQADAAAYQAALRANGGHLPSCTRR